MTLSSYLFYEEDKYEREKNKHSSAVRKLHGSIVLFSSSMKEDPEIGNIS